MVGEVEGVDIEFVPRLTEEDGHIGRSVFGRIGFGSVDIVVVLNTTVLGIFEVVTVVHGVQYVALVAVGAVEDAVEMGRVLVFVVAAAVEVVQFESHAQAFPRIGGKEGGDAVLAVLFVAAGVVGKVGDGRLGVGELQSLHAFQEEVVGAGEEELLAIDGHIVEEQTAGAGRAEVARGVVRALAAFGEGIVLETVGEGVGLAGGNLCKPRFDAPDLEADGHINGLHAVRAFIPMRMLVIVRAYTLGHNWRGRGHHQEKGHGSKGGTKEKNFQYGRLFHVKKEVKAEGAHFLLSPRVSFSMPHSGHRPASSNSAPQLPQRKCGV